MFRDWTEPTLFRAGTVPETVPVRSLETTQSNVMTDVVVTDYIWCSKGLVAKQDAQ